LISYKKKSMRAPALFKQFTWISAAPWLLPKLDSQAVAQRTWQGMESCNAPDRS
jgi:hypothetical protein